MPVVGKGGRAGQEVEEGEAIFPKKKEEELDRNKRKIISGLIVT